MAADTPSRRRRAALLAGAVLMLLAVAGLVLRATSSPGDPKETLAAYQEAINARDVDGVYERLCADRRDLMPRSYVADRLSEVPSAGVPLLDDVRTGEPREGPDGMEVDVRYRFGGQPGESTLVLVDEDGWRLCGGSWVDF